ncbi:sulfotransferase family protein [Roseivirga sp.]|uniref:sulfotransferase family protein n=1 Tax=Roseivirga sp. TaxID=1964215 RepID=UPI003B8B9C0E
MSTFFIAGEQRSGTTLLSVILSRHSQIHLDGNSLGFRLVTCLLKLPPQVLQYNLKHAPKEVLAWLIKNDYKGRLSDLIDLEKLHEFTDSRSAVGSGIEKKLLESGKKVFGDKSPRVHYFMPELLTIIPEAKFIHVVRDGRAVALSRKKRAKKNLLLGAQEWVDSNILGLSNKMLVGEGAYLFVKYEDLLTKPEDTIRGICKFLKLDFEEYMLVGQKESKGDESYVHSDFRTDKIHSFQTELNTRQRRNLERIQGPLLKRLGYDLEFEFSDRLYKDLGIFRRIWLNQLDNFGQLLISKRTGMRDRKNVDIHIPVSTRVKTFIFELGRDLLPDKVFKRVFRKRWVKNIYINE